MRTVVKIAPPGDGKKVGYKRMLVLSRKLERQTAEEAIRGKEKNS